MLELVVVIIIVGVLSSLALPRYFKLIELARAPEAITNMKAIRDALERCYAMTNSYSVCQWSDYIENPNDLPNRHFQYTAESSGDQSLFIYAYRNTYELSYNNVSCTVSCLNRIFITAPPSLILCVDQTAKQIQIRGCGIYASIH